MNLERIKVLNEHLETLNSLAEKNVAVYREINETNRAIHQEITAYTSDGTKVDLEYHVANNNDTVTWDDFNHRVLVDGIKLTASDVIQAVRIHGSIRDAAKELGLMQIQVSNVLCFAAKVIADDRY